MTTYSVLVCVVLCVGGCTTHDGYNMLLCIELHLTPPQPLAWVLAFGGEGGGGGVATHRDLLLCAEKGGRNFWRVHHGMSVCTLNDVVC